jgi:hypothetical protein
MIDTAAITVVGSLIFGGRRARVFGRVVIAVMFVIIVRIRCLWFFDLQEGRARLV